MLKNVPKIISGELLKVLCEMGHGDTIAIVDANYPAQYKGRNTIVINYPGMDATTLLSAIMELLPLDHIVDCPVEVMAMEQKDIDAGMPEPKFWSDVEKTVKPFVHNDMCYKKISRDEFYDKSEVVCAIIQTGEERLYGDVILRKGVL